MERKPTFYTEAAYGAGIVILALGTAFMERADMGLSMVVAPAYLIYRALSPSFPAFSFGMAEYCFQALLLSALTLVLRRGRKSYLFSFATAFLYGNALDLAMKLVALLPGDGFALRLVFFIVGMLLGAVGVAFFFRAYITPEAYELVVKELSAAYGLSIARVKTGYDCASCLIGVALSFLFFGFGHFEGVKLGTAVCALLNGWLIGRAGAAMDRLWQFEDALPLRRFFEQKT